MSEGPKDPSLESEVKPKVPYVERCACGNDRKHYMVSAVPTYTTWGQFWVALMGVSANPIRIDFQCRVCKEKFDFITDPQELRSHL